MEAPRHGSQNIGIVGLGLIGGSLGLDLQALGHTVHGITSRELTAKRAKERGLAQIISNDFSTLSNCSIIILALPLSQLINPPEELINALPKQAVVTDVGSVKMPIQATWDKLHPRFVPSHPMAGTARAGVEAGQSGLFKGSLWVVTPSNNTDSEALEIIHHLAISIKSKWLSVDAKAHDEAVALISHLPIFVSAALLKALTDHPDNSLLELAQLLSSTGFADTTRVGGGNPNLGVDIASNNTEALLDALNSYRLSISQLEEIIQSKQWNKLNEELEKTKVTRHKFS